MAELLSIESIYTDGACSGNPGRGGWGVVVRFADGRIWELGGAAAETTNNRMEMQAGIEALQFWLDRTPDLPVTLHSDSEYLIKGLTKWMAGWKKRNWQTSAGKPVLNRDLWERLDRLNNPSLVTWQHVRGHSGVAGNERCDAIARAFSLAQIPTLKQDGIEVAEPSSANSATPMTIDSSPEPQTSIDELRVTSIHNLVETLRVADEIASKGYWITSSELADLMDVNASAVTSRGERWTWRNWIVSRVRREGNQILWQLERVD